MKRRTFLSNTLLGSAALAAGTSACSTPQEGGGGGAAAAHTQKQVKWRLASSFPRSLDTIFGAAEVMAERVSAMTGGSFSIRVYPAGELVPGLQVLDAAQQGTVQVGQTCGYYYIGKAAALAFDTCVPFGLTARQQVGWLEEGGGRDLINEVLADFGCISFSGGNTGVQMGGWFKPEVNTLDELKGLKMRIPGMGGKAMEALGVATQTIAGGEIFPALERGAIDATDWVGPYDDEKLGFYKVAKNYYYPGWWEPGPNMSYYVNQKAYDSLPAEYKEVLAVACRESALIMMARYDAKNPAAFKRLLGHGVKVRPFSDAILEAARDASEQLHSDNSADAAYKKVFGAWDVFRRDAFDWWGAAERAYSNFAFA